MVKSTQLAELSRSRAKQNRKAVNEVSQHPAQKNRKNIRKETEKKTICDHFVFHTFCDQIEFFKEKSHILVLRHKFLS